GRLQRRFRGHDRRSRDDARATLRFSGYAPGRRHRHDAAIALWLPGGGRKSACNRHPDPRRLGRGPATPPLREERLPKCGTLLIEHAPVAKTRLARESVILKNHGFVQTTPEPSCRGPAPGRTFSAASP